MTTASESAPRRLAELDTPDVEPGAGRQRAAEIARRDTRLAAWTVVLDDDPTGTQTVRDVPILMGHVSEDDLREASTHPSRMTFVMTNSRSLDRRSAYEITYSTVVTAARVSARSGRRLRIVSRGDSTLRGHFSAELEAVHDALHDAGASTAGTLFVPAFIEAGRITASDVQWVSGDQGFIPVAQTEYAADATFGYSERRLSDWVVAQGGRPASRTPINISLRELRSPTSAHIVAARLAGLRDEQVAIADAVRPSDLESLMLAVLEREEAGHRLVFRAGPSFVRACAGQEVNPPVAGGLSRGNGHGLIAVGSHTDLTTAQIDRAADDFALAHVELDAGLAVRDRGSRDREVERSAQAVLAELERGHVLLSTKRHVVTSPGRTSLETSRVVAAALSDVVRRVTAAVTPFFIIAKGGITSHELAVTALGVRRARVIGQMFSGMVPVWELLDGVAPGMPYIVFPGNVGAQDSLSLALRKLVSP